MGRLKELTDSQIEELALRVVSSRSNCQISFYKLKILLDHMKVFTNTSNLLRSLEKKKIIIRQDSENGSYLYELTAYGKEFVAQFNPIEEFVQGLSQIDSLAIDRIKNFFNLDKIDKF
jgi:predicted transcriptional regulator